MQVNIFEPLGLDHTTLYPEVAEELGKADGHQPMYGGIVVRNMPFFRSAMSAGWVMSCAEIWDSGLSPSSTTELHPPDRYFRRTISRKCICRP